MKNYTPKYYFTAIQNRRSAPKKTVILQRLLKSGKWGKPTEYEMWNDKTAEEVIARLERNNPGDTWRIAQ